MIYLLFLICFLCPSLIQASEPIPQDMHEDKFELIVEHEWPTDPEELRKPIPSPSLKPSRVLYRRPDGSGVATNGEQLVTRICDPVALLEPSSSRLALPTMQEVRRLTTLQDSDRLKVGPELLPCMFKRSNVTGFFYASQEINGQLLATVYFKPLTTRDKELLGSLKD